MYLLSFLRVLARYACLPSIFDSLLEAERSAIVVVISPLVSSVYSRIPILEGNK